MSRTAKKYKPRNKLAKPEKVSSTYTADISISKHREDLKNAKKPN